MSLFPVPSERVELWNLYCKLRERYWLPGEIPYEDDIVDWKSASSAMTNVLAGINEYFLNADNIVTEFIEEKLVEHYKDDRHVTALLTYIKANEAIHAETYDKYITVAIPPVMSNKIRASDASRIPQMEWISNFYKSNLLVAHLLVAHIINEGVFFMSTFDVIACIDTMFPGTFKAFSKMNEMISVDEMSHCTSSCLLLTEKMANGEITADEVIAYFRSGVHAAEKFAAIILSERLADITYERMVKTIKFRANFWLDQLGIKPIYSSEESEGYLHAMRFDVTNRVTDFFSSRVAEYAIIGTCSDKDILDIFK